MKWAAACLSDPGKVRTNNEDACRVDEDLGLFLVADGIDRKSVV
jgi:serine/threonine protein phosphatase PrpC